MRYMLSFLSPRSISDQYYIHVSNVKCLYYPLASLPDYVLQSVDLVALTILLFDHLLTFVDEVKYIWKHKMTFFSALFLANRYFAPIAMICYTVGMTLPYDLQDRIYPKFRPAVAFTIQSAPPIIIAEVLLVFRVYAVYQRNKVILVLLISSLVVQIGIGIYIVIADIDPSNVFNVQGLMIYIHSLVFDSLVAGFLTFGLYQRSKPLVPKMSLAALIIRDGLLYFFVVFGSNTALTIVGLLLHYKFKAVLSNNYYYDWAANTQLKRT
ncbi:hypothetical protein BDZ94DRAFT_1238759 [Collybia nuda]|uniref:DUF6533 domain-containing protein n=1 Tax=Collybia nuda TaxID=64659 RepID=A0A9P5Y2K1_9AGAR|nr:hypothetical protein BDZ94DRAFT_1238759 [Collybia nuda]